MMKKKGKNEVEKEPRWARELGIKVEDIDHKVSLIAEQYEDIKETLDAHTKTLASHTEMIGSIMVDIEIIKQDILLSLKIL